MYAVARIAPCLRAEATSAVRCVASSCALRATMHTSAVVLQAKKGKSAPAAAAPAVVEKFDLKKQIPVNLLKEGSEPEYQPDSAYPPWLFKLLEEKPILEDYIMMGLDKVPQEEMKRVYRMANKRRVKAGNDERRKE